ncbi:unknown [Anaerotruncus sp. CAG:390]|nr:unknown [Anaerotruncus sp. CAG:390]
MPSYLLPRRISRSTNFWQSSTMYLIGASASPESAAFCFACATIPLAASTWHTAAPAAAAATVAPPVYAKRLRTFTLLPDLTASPMISENQSQFTACSGKRPVCLKPIGLRRKRRFP